MADLTLLKQALGFTRVKYSVTLIESEEGWAVWCEQMPGCCSQGAPREEALANIREAIAEFREAQSLIAGVTR